MKFKDFFTKTFPQTAEHNEYIEKFRANGRVVVEKSCLEFTELFSRQDESDATNVVS